jgi:hypothetical protein
MHPDHLRNFAIALSTMYPRCDESIVLAPKRARTQSRSSACECGRQQRFESCSHQRGPRATVPGLFGAGDSWSRLAMTGITNGGQALAQLVLEYTAFYGGRRKAQERAARDAAEAAR